ncbi:NAD(P)/FAD-dependent oxidoreductase [Nocardia bovistercoris]|uniref:FAD-dependent oxidoreductase n=1 Tax=Nocardia bovistercoris TaxID=2785916 RepID=A0A931IGY1_9NOCA|nr:FAD-dependent oxidoreductase [Nocardia bovistercoris]
MANVAIVGGGIAGVSAAAALRSGGFTGEITLVDAGEFPYDRPPLSKDFLSGRKSLSDIALQPDDWYDRNKVRLLSGRTATALRPGTGQVELSDGTAVTADRVVLATGGHALRPPIPGADGARVHLLRTARDADALRARLTPGARALVVGAGLIGAEVASTARDLGCEVVMVDPVSPPLAAAVGADLARWLHEQHAIRGIRTEATTVRSLRESGPIVHAEFGDGTGEHAFDAVLLGVGMAPDTALARAAGLDVDRGILVDDAQVTSNPAVLAVGDSARVRRGGEVLARTEHWEAAQRDGGRAAAAILGTAPPADGASWFWTDRHGVHVEVVGYLGVAESVVVRGEFGPEPFSVFGLVGDRVVAAAAVGDSGAVRAARRLIDRGIAVDRERLTDPSVDLKKLVRG